MDGLANKIEFETGLNTTGSEYSRGGIAQLCRMGEEGARPWVINGGARRKTVQAGIPVSLSEVNIMGDPATIRDFDAMLRKLYEMLGPEETLRRVGLTPEEVVRILTPEERLAGLDPKERLAGLDPKERLAGLDPKERLAGLDHEELERLQDAIRARLGRS